MHGVEYYPHGFHELPRDQNYQERYEYNHVQPFLTEASVTSCFLLVFFCQVNVVSGIHRYLLRDYAFAILVEESFTIPEFDDDSLFIEERTVESELHLQVLEGLSDFSDVQFVSEVINIPLACDFNIQCLIQAGYRSQLSISETYVLYM